MTASGPKPGAVALEPPEVPGRTWGSFGPRLVIPGCRQMGLRATRTVRGTAC